MLTACATGDDGIQRILLGVTRENIDRLVAQYPIHVNAETHSGFPDKLTVIVVFAETERDLYELLKPLIGPETKIVIEPEGRGRVS